MIIGLACSRRRPTERQYFKKVVNITDFHHFKMSAEEPGVVTCSVEVDSEPIGAKEKTALQYISGHVVHKIYAQLRKSKHWR